MKIIDLMGRHFTAVCAHCGAPVAYGAALDHLAERHPLEYAGMVVKTLAGASDGIER